LSLDSFHLGSDISGSVDSLENNPNLQSLRITNLPPDAVDFGPWLIPLLQSAAGAMHLEEIILEFLPFIGVDEIDSAAIDEVFESTAFPALTTVTIDVEIYQRPGNEAYEVELNEVELNEAESQFPYLQRRKLLKIVR
jgi:hypothetical protein